MMTTARAEPPVRWPADTELRRLTANIMCYDDKIEFALEVEVKGDALTLVQLKSTISRACSSAVTKILFMTPGFTSGDKDAVLTSITEEFAQGSNVDQTSIGSLVRSSFMLLSEDWRVTFLHEICSELDEGCA